MTGMLSLLDRPIGIGGPLTPRPRIQLRAREASVLEGEQVVTRGDTGPAVADDLIRGHVADRRPDSRAQFFRRPEEPLLVQVPLKEVILRAGYVTGDPVDRFGVAAVALRRAGVDQTRPAARHLRGYRLHVYRHVRVRRAGDVSPYQIGVAAFVRPAFTPSFLESV